MKLRNFWRSVGTGALATALVGGALVTGLGTPAAQAVIAEPGISSTVAGTTSTASTAGKAKGSGLWGYAGDVKTHSSGYVFNYGAAISPADGSLWVTDSAKIVWTSSGFVCLVNGGVMKTGAACYVGESKVHRYALDSSADWATGQYQSNGSFSTVAAGVNGGIGANYPNLSDAQIIKSTPESGIFLGARGVSISQSGQAWVVDSDASGNYDWADQTYRTVRVLNPDGTEANAIGAVSWANGGTANANRYAPDAFFYPVGIARTNDGGMIVTNEGPYLLKEYEEDGTFVRNVYVAQPEDANYKWHAPYAVAVDPADGTWLVGYVQPGAGNQAIIERIDPNNCTTHPQILPTGSSYDRCEVLDTIGAGTLVPGSASGNAGTTFAIQVEPSTGDIYVGQQSGQLQVFASDGTPKGAFSAFGGGTANGQVATVRGIAFDERGFLYLTVSEGTANARVEIFARTPDPITGLSGVYTDASKTSATLSWDALDTGVTADAQAPLRDYVIEQSTDGGTTWAVLSTPTDTVNSYTVTGLDPNTSYQYRVSAWNEAGNGDTAITPLSDPLPAVSGLSIVKTGNGIETDTVSDAVQVNADSTVSFEYTVTNTGETGDADVTGISLTDSVIGAVTSVVSPAGFSGTLSPGESAVFAASGPVAAGAYQNTATVTGESAGEDVQASDVWYGFGVTRGLSLTKTGNGESAPTAADAVAVPADSSVIFNYTVTNNGNVPVTGLTVTDDVLGAVATPAGFDGTLAANGGSVTFTASGPVAAGAYVNVATAAGSSAGSPVSTTDEWHGFGTDTGLSVVKTGNGVANGSAADAVVVPADATVEFNYTVTNTGNVPVTDLTLNDDVLGLIAAPAGFDGTLAANGGSVTFTASGTVAAGDYHNTVIVSGVSDGQDVTADDEWFGFGAVPGLAIVKAGNDVVNDSASDAVHVEAGGSVTFEYTVTNTGNVDLNLGDLIDDQIGTVAAPAGFSGALAANGGSVTFTATGNIAAGAYKNIAHITASDVTAATSEASDDWYGYGDVKPVTPDTPSNPDDPDSPVVVDEPDDKTPSTQPKDERELEVTGSEHTIAITLPIAVGLILLGGTLVALRRRRML